MEYNGCTIMIDPYLSDSLRESDADKFRRVPVQHKFYEINPDIIIITHEHADHYDPETLKVFLAKPHKMTVLAPWSVWSKMRFKSNNINFVSFNSGTVWSEGKIRFSAVYAEHSDHYAIGVVINAEDKNYYITGDTLYSEKIFDILPKKIYAVFLPVNGQGNNMNMIDAAKFARKINAKNVVPLHCGLLDNINVCTFKCPGKVEPVIYEEIKL